MRIFSTVLDASFTAKENAVPFPFFAEFVSKQDCRRIEDRPWAIKCQRHVVARSLALYSVPSMHQRTSGMNDLAIPRLSFSLLRPIIHECGLQHSERSSKNEAAVNLNSFISF